jgi:hypothetical protein
MRRWLSVVLGMGLAFVALPAAAVAAPPDPSAVTVSTTSLAPGDIFTATVELFNADTGTITSVNAQLRTLEAPIVDLLDVVSCTGTIFACHPFNGVFRGPVGNMAPGETRTVVFTFQVKATAAAGSYTLEHQFSGGNFEFAPRLGPVLTISVPAADIAVSLGASSQGLLSSRVTYTVGVTNNGPGSATSVRVAGTYAQGFNWVGGNGCVRTSGRNVQCDFSSLPVGGSATATFRLDAALLAIGSFNTTMTRVSSTPADPVSGNDSASRSCTALTGLIVQC